MKGILLIFLFNQFNFSGKHLPYPPFNEYTGHYPVEKVKFEYRFYVPSGFQMPPYHTESGELLYVKNPKELSDTEKSLFRKALNKWLEKMKEIGTDNNLPPWANGRVGYETVEEVIYNLSSSVVYKGKIMRITGNDTIPTNYGAVAIPNPYKKYPQEVVIYPFHIIFNTDFESQWHLDTTSPPSGKISFYTMAMHEIGHVLGLEHYNDPQSVMNPTIQAGNGYLPSPDNGSIAGACYIYPRFYTFTSDILEYQKVWKQIAPLNYYIKDVPFFYPGKGNFAIAGDSVYTGNPEKPFKDLMFIGVLHFDTYKPPAPYIYEYAGRLGWITPAHSLGLLEGDPRCYPEYVIPPEERIIEGGVAQFGIYLRTMGIFSSQPTVYNSFWGGIYHHIFHHWAIAPNCIECTLNEDDPPCSPYGYIVHEGYSKIYFAHVPEEYYGFGNSGKGWDMTPSIPPQIDENMNKKDIPPNNNNRINRDTSGLFHQLASKNDSIFDFVFNDTTFVAKFFIGEGNNPALATDSQGNMYVVWAYNDTLGHEELRFSKFENGNWTPYTTIHDNYNTYIWGIGAPTFYIKGDTGYVALETTIGPCWHIPGGPPYPCVAVLIEKRALAYIKFNLNNPSETKDTIIEAINISPIGPIELSYDSFYIYYVPTLKSPSLVVDENNKVHISWEGIKDSLRYYIIQNNQIERKILSSSDTVLYPNAYTTSLRNNFLWIEKMDSLYFLKESHSYAGIDTPSTPQTLYSSSISQLLDPVSFGNYYVYVEKWEGGSILWFCDFDTLREKLFSAPEIYSPQMFFDTTQNRFYITFYAGDSLRGFRIYKVIKDIGTSPLLFESFGNETPSPLTIYREGRIETVLKEDYGDSLVYKIPVFTKDELRIKLVAYNPENKKIKAKIFVNKKPLGNWEIEPYKKDIFEKKVKIKEYTKYIKLKLLKKKGENIYLSKLYIFKNRKKTKTTSGIQEIPSKPILRFDVKVNTFVEKGKDIFLLIPEKGNVKFSIFDVSGRKIYGFEKIIHRGIHPVSVPELRTGVYFIEVKFKDKKKIRKVIRIK